MVRDRQSFGSHMGPSPQSEKQQSDTGPLTIVTENMTNAEVDRVIENARRANTELHIRDNNGKVIQNNYQNPKRGQEDNFKKITLKKKPQK